MFRAIANVLYCVIFLGWTTFAAGVIKVLGLFPVSKKTSQRNALIVTKACWAIAFFFTPWIRLKSDWKSFDKEWEAVRKKVEAQDAEVAANPKIPYQPVMMLSNHSSFLDVPMATRAMPWWAYLRERTYMASHLYGIPVLCTIVKAIGHFPVFFASGTDGVFKLDEQKMEIVEAEVSQFMTEGGWMSFFPEGQVNKTPDKLMPFRYGGMRRALACDARIVFVVFHGNPKVWGPKATITGYPGKVKLDVKVVALDGVKAYIKKVRDDGLEEDEKQMADEELLAKRFRIKMQEMYNNLKAEATGSSGVADKKKD